MLKYSLLGMSLVDGELNNILISQRLKGDKYV